MVCPLAVIGEWPPNRSTDQNDRRTRGLFVENGPNWNPQHDAFLLPNARGYLRRFAEDVVFVDVPNAVRQLGTDAFIESDCRSANHDAILPEIANGNCRAAC